MFVKPIAATLALAGLALCGQNMHHAPHYGMSEQQLMTAIVRGQSIDIDDRTYIAHQVQPRCPKPAELPSGAYSAYRTAGTMPSGTFVIMTPTGDRWSCVNGKVIVS